MSWAWLIVLVTGALNLIGSCFVLWGAKTNRRTTDLLGVLMKREGFDGSDR